MSPTRRFPRPDRRPGPRAAVSLGLVVSGLAALACGPAEPRARLLELRQARPEPGATGVFLNEPLELYFSEELDPASVHALSARVQAADGEPARGRWEVSGRRLVFTPDPVLAPDLSDGGYRPGRAYQVELSGFPRPDGLRAASGAPLGRTLRWEFRVVSPGDPGSGFVFEDASLERGLPLVLRSHTVPPSGPIVLEGEEPLDPSTLFGEDFLLQRWGEPSDGGGQTLGPPVALRARLVQNFDKRAVRPRGTTLVELLPAERLEVGVGYLLQMRFQARLRDFGGHPVPYLPALSGTRALVEVRESAAPAADVHFEPFLGTRNRSPEIVPGVDGTAWWGGSGRVEVRLPAAVGDGRSGQVELDGPVTSSDLQAVRLRVPAGRRAELSSEPGLVVVRAQGSLRVEGALVRRVETSDVPTFGDGERLSDWLARTAAEGLTATVLVAGGDLTVLGELDVSGTLLLVAGGRVRLADQRERLRAAQIYVLGEGGQGLQFLDSSARDEPRKTNPAPLELDLARTNPLVEPLTFAVRSGPIPRQGQAARWRGPPRQGGHAGSGSYRVRYVGSSPGRLAGERIERIVEDPMQLGDSPSLRLQVELVVSPGPTWDPPWVDYAEVSWEPLGRERSR